MHLSVYTYPDFDKSECIADALHTPVLDIIPFYLDYTEKLFQS